MQHILTTNGTNMPLVGSVTRRWAWRGYTDLKMSRVSDVTEWVRTYELQQQRCRVQQEQGHVDKVEHGLDHGERVRGVVLQARKRHVHSARTHANWVLQH